MSASSTIQPNATNTGHSGVVSSGQPSLLPFESLVCDLNWTLLHTGILAHVLNAASRNKAAVSLRPWARLLTEDASAMLLGLKYGAQLGISDTAAAKIETFYLKVAEAKTLTSGLPLVGRLDANRDSRQVDLIAKKWREASKDGLETARQAAPLVRARLNPFYTEDLRSLAQFLDDAAAGMSDCVSSSGEVTLPLLHQRRRSPRVDVQLGCKLHVGGSVIAATIVDVSSRGIGLESEQSMSAGMEVVIELPGRRMHGTVARTVGNRSGIILAKALAMNDPLLAGGIQNSYACCAGATAPKACAPGLPCPLS